MYYLPYPYLLSCMDAARPLGTSNNVSTPQKIEQVWVGHQHISSVPAPEPGRLALTPVDSVGWSEGGAFALLVACDKLLGQSSGPRGVAMAGSPTMSTYSSSALTLRMPLRPYILFAITSHRWPVCIMRLTTLNT
jgi:hypothetical protein